MQATTKSDLTVEIVIRKTNEINSEIRETFIVEQIDFYGMAHLLKEFKRLTYEVNDRRRVKE